MKLLSYDGMLAQTIRVVWRYCVLNFCFLVCSLPVVTAGSAITALYAVMLPVPEETGYVKKYFKAFASNLKQASAIWMALLGPLVALILAVYFTAIVPFPGRELIRVLEAVFAVLLMMLLCYVFPLQARYDNPPKTTVRNAFVLCIGAFLPGLLMATVALAPAILFLVDIELFVQIFSVCHFFAFAVIVRVNSAICMFVFSKLDPPTQNPDDYEGENE